MVTGLVALERRRAIPEAMKNRALAAVALVVAVVSLSGCQLCLLPCYVCAAVAGGGGQASDEVTTREPLPELQPRVRTGLTTASLKN